MLVWYCVFVFFEVQSNLRNDGTVHGNLDDKSVFGFFLPKRGSNKRLNKGVWWASNSNSKEDGHCRRPWSCTSCTSCTWCTWYTCTSAGAQRRPAKLCNSSSPSLRSASSLVARWHRPDADTQASTTRCCGHSGRVEANNTSQEPQQRNQFVRQGGEERVEHDS